MQDFTDTICALSTPHGNGAIAVIRISGRDAVSISDGIFEFPHKNKKLSTQKANTSHFGRILHNNEYIDEVILNVFRAPHSYTGEDTIEISCHGSVFIQQKMLQLLVEKGARLAKPGEYTLRAFLNGKIDLSQAEGVADLIASSTASSHWLALQQMRGGFSTEIKKLRHELLGFISLIELELDFSEEDIEFADRKKLLSLIDQMDKMIGPLIRSFEYGNAIKHGIPVAIIGRTNSGKSTLLNLLLREDKAIVSEIAGTTRDSIEDTVVLRGFQFRFIDTAGLRHTTDQIETIGIERTYKKYTEASVVIVLIDIKENQTEVNKSFEFLRKKEPSAKQIVFVLNKIDQVSEELLSEKISAYKSSWGDMAQVIGISAKKGLNIEELEDLLVSPLQNKIDNENEVVVTNVRHFEALKHASAALYRAKEGLMSQLTTDMLAIDIHEVLNYLGEITGEITTDEILGNIFKNFCIGK
jgi:tRNA modification GTPase